MTQKLIPFMKGYKATNADMTCTPTTDIRYQFEMDKIFVHEGKLDICGSGFHFCVFPSGVWSFYSSPDTRVFEIEAYDVLDERDGFGAEVKMVAQKIKFIREIKIGGHSNTGDSNTGYSNTGYRNTGYRNTGHSNTGHWNTGYSNTGDRNTGDRNTGHWNTGYWNTGYWNSTDYSSGFFCAKEPTVISFDVQTNHLRSVYLDKYPECYDLGDELLNDSDIDLEKYKNIPGITKRKLTILHNKFKKARKENNK